MDESQVSIAGTPIAPGTAQELTGTPTERDRGRVFIYDTKTGERSEILVTMLPQALRKKRADGLSVFTDVKPDFEPVRGKLKCPLHPDGPNRKYYDTLGLPICMKSNITAPFHVMRHMKSRHKVEWGIIEQAKKDVEEAKRKAERIEDREFQQYLMDKAMEKPPKKAPLYISKKDKAKIE